MIEKLYMIEGDDKNGNPVWEGMYRSIEPGI
jgi:hypothetical protein